MSFLLKQGVGGSKMLCSARSAVLGLDTGVGADRQAHLNMQLPSPVMECFLNAVRVPLLLLLKLLLLVTLLLLLLPLLLLLLLLAARTSTCCCGWCGCGAAAVGQCLKCVVRLRPVPAAEGRQTAYWCEACDSRAGIRPDAACWSVLAVCMLAGSTITRMQPGWR